MRNSELRLADPAELDNIQIARADTQSFKHNGKLIHCHQEEEDPTPALSESEDMAAQLMRKILLWVIGPDHTQKTRVVRLLILSHELWGHPSSYRGIAREVGCHVNYVSVQALELRKSFPLFRAKVFSGKRQRRK